jgi:hypothetical protein
MKFNLFKFYRLDFCLRNLGLGVIGIFSSGPAFDIKLSLLALVNILLIQMHSFSANDLFDFKAFGEENYIMKLKKTGVSLKLCLFLTLLPLIFLIVTVSIYKAYSYILFLYIFLFYLYQAPPFRLKNNYLLSIVINAVCLGASLFLYPYLLLANKLNPLGLFFTILFFCYLAFHELIHQIAHLGRDKICSLPSKIGIDRTVGIAICFLVIAILTGAWGLIFVPAGKIIFIIPIIFSAIRLYKLSKIPAIQENFIKLRDRWDKFYTVQEGLLYITFLTLWK